MTSVKDGASWRPKSYHVFNVTSAIQTRQGHLQFPIVTEHDNLFDIWDEITDEGTIYCAKIILDRSEGSPNGVRHVKGVCPIILGKGGVITIDPPYYETIPDEVAEALQDFDWGMGRETDEAE